MQLIVVTNRDEGRRKQARNELTVSGESTETTTSKRDDDKQKGTATSKGDDCPRPKTGVVGKLSNAESGDQDSIPGKTRLLKERQHRCGYDHRDIIPTSSKSNSWKNKARK
ncbi:hypothetical protein ACFE04_019878 [Oxalis oulophora]